MQVGIRERKEKNVRASDLRLEKKFNKFEKKRFLP
jgi:hypothetical protein